MFLLEICSSAWKVFNVFQVSQFHLSPCGELSSKLRYGFSITMQVSVCRRVLQILHGNLQVSNRRDLGCEACGVDAGLVRRDQAERLHVRAHQHYALHLERVGAHLVGLGLGLGLGWG